MLSFPIYGIPQLCKEQQARGSVNKTLVQKHLKSNFELRMRFVDSLIRIMLIEIKVPHTSLSILMCKVCVCAYHKLEVWLPTLPVAVFHAS